MTEIRVDNYSLPLDLGHKLTSTCMEIQDDIVAKTGVPEQVAVQLVAKVLNRLAYSIHELGRPPEEDDDIN
jgi:uncharacterized membrane protein YjfL (UPF0719 family)